MNIFKLASFAFITSIMCVSALAGSAIYKWKDKDGVVHYSQNAPIGQETEIITTKTPRSAETTVDSESDEAENEEEEATDVSEEDAEDDGEEKTGKAAPVATKDQATCDKALKAIQDLQNNPIVTVNGKVMTIEEKNTQLSNMDEIVKVHCP